MNPWLRIQTVFQKELLDSIRDRRTLRTSLLTPLLGPLILVILITVQVKAFSRNSEQTISLPIAQPQNAPNLVAFLKQAGILVLPAPKDPEAEVREGNIDVILVIPPDYGKSLAAGEPATVRIISDRSRQTAQVTVGRVRDLVRQYSRQIGNLRLLARGLSPSMTQALALEEVDVGTLQSRSAVILGTMPYFIIFSAFIGGLYIAIDTTAGERERGSLESLIINPIPRWELLVGKLMATMVFTTVAVAETVAALALTLNFVPLDELGLQIELNPLTFFAIFLVTLPILLVAASLQTLIALFTRNFREALNYLQLLPLIPALPGLLLVFLPIKATWWMMLIPTFGQQLLITQLIRGETIQSGFVALASGTTLLVGAGIAWAAAWLFGREEVIFGRS